MMRAFIGNFNEKPLFVALNSERGGCYDARPVPRFAVGIQQMILKVRVSAMPYWLLGIILMLGILPAYSVIAAESGQLEGARGMLFFIGKEQTGREPDGTPTGIATLRLFSISLKTSKIESWARDYDSAWKLKKNASDGALFFSSNSDDPAKDGWLSLVLRVGDKIGGPDAARITRLDLTAYEKPPIEWDSKNDTFSFSPDGKWFAAPGSIPGPFEGSRKEAVFWIAPVGNLQAGHYVKQMAHSTTPPAWSPDGSRVAFTGNLEVNESFEKFDQNSFEIFIVNRDGTGLKQLTDLPKKIPWWEWMLRRPGTNHRDLHKTGYPQWSPDGKSIFFVSFGGIYSARLDGSEVKLIVKVGTDPALSPDGKLIAYVANRSDAPLLDKSWGRYQGGRLSNIYISRTDGTGEVRVTDNRKVFDYSNLVWVEE